VPAIGPYYWLVFAVATVFGANMGDFLSQDLGMGTMGGLPLLVFALIVVLVSERLDDSSNSKAWYWAAIVLIPMAAGNLGEFGVAHGYSRRWILAGLGLLLIITYFGGRSEAEHLLAMRMLTRPGRAGRPMTDVNYWIAMIVASTIGPVAVDFCAFGLGLGSFVTGAIMLGLLAGSFALYLLPASSRPLVHWLTVVLIRAAGTSMADVLSAGPGLHMGLVASTVAAGLATLLLLLLWPPESSARNSGPTR